MSDDEARERVLQFVESLSSDKFEVINSQDEGALHEWAYLMRSFLKTNNPLHLIIAFTGFVEQGKYPPAYLLKEIAKKFNLVMDSDASLDVAFGLKAKGKGSSTATQKEIALLFTNIKLYKMFLLINKYNLSIEQAAELVASSTTNNMRSPLSAESLADYYSRNQDFKKMKPKLILTEDIDMSEYDQSLVRMYCVN